MRARVAAAWLLLALLAAAAGAPEASQPQSPLDEPGRRGGDGRGDHADVSALMDMFFPWGAPNPSGSKNPVVPPGQFFNETLANAMAQGVITEAQRQRICDLRLGLYSYYWAIVGDPITTAYILDFVRAFCFSALNQFVFLGNPSDTGEGEFAPEAFAIFVLNMANLGCRVNVFFDETVLPTPAAPETAVCQNHCAGVSSNDDDRMCHCDGVPDPQCMWQHCDPTPVNKTVTNPPPCCCASIDIKMQWVVDVQHSLRQIDPSLTLGGVNVDIENVGNCYRTLLLTYMRDYLSAAGENLITVGDTIGYETGTYVWDHFGVPGLVNTTGVPAGYVVTPPLAVLYIQNYNLPAVSDDEHGFSWYAGSYIAAINPEASNANLQIMFTLNCCNGPCANPASGSGSPTSCDDCGVCCSANTYCQATTRLGLNDAWGDPQTQGAFCPYKSLKNGTRITTDMLITELYNAQAAVMAAPNYASLAPRNVTVTLTAYELRSLHILLFGMDLTCGNLNYCKPHIFPDGSGFDDVCGTTACCGGSKNDTLCVCTAPPSLP